MDELELEEEIAKLKYQMSQTEDDDEIAEYRKQIGELENELDEVRREKAKNSSEEPIKNPSSDKKYKDSIEDDEEEEEKKKKEKEDKEEEENEEDENNDDNDDEDDDQKDEEDENEEEREEEEEQNNDKKEKEDKEKEKEKKDNKKKQEKKQKQEDDKQKREQEQKREQDKKNDTEKNKNQNDDIQSPEQRNRSKRNASEEGKKGDTHKGEGTKGSGSGQATTEGSKAVAETSSTASSAGGSAAAGESAAVAGESAAAAGGGSAAAGGAAAGGAAAGGAVAVLGWVLLIVIIVIIILIVLIGALAFFSAMPGMVVQKITKFLDNIWTKVKSLVIGADKATVQDENVVAVAQYLKDMGYDLEGCGFVDRRGKITYDGENSANNDADVSKIDSQYIWAYLVAENRTYLIRNHNLNLSSMFNSLKKSILDADWMNTVRDFGVGMLNIEEKWWGIFDGKISVDREKKILTVEDHQYDKLWFVPIYTHTEVYHYNMEGWTGRYGKPLEFLLSLHLATMAPDLVYQVALDPDLDAKVNISFHEADVTFSFRYKLDRYTILTPNEIASYPTALYLNSDYSSNEEIAEQLQTKVVKLRTPYITSITDHWFRDVYFKTSSNKEVVVTEKGEDGEFWDKYDSNDKLVTEKISGINVYEVADTNRSEYSTNLSGLPGEVLVTERREGNIIQTKDARRGITNKKTKEIFKDQKYYIYDGTVDRAEKIKESAKGNGTIEKEYININKEALAAFSMLENTHTVDADYIYKDLKELLIELEYFEREDLIKKEKGIFSWFIKGYTPKEWPERRSDKEIVEYGTKVSSRAEIEKLENTTGETFKNKGFEQGHDVVSPFVGEIVDKGSDYITLKVLDTDKISEYKDFYDKYKDVCAGYKLDIRGITNITSKALGEYVEEGETIGETTYESIVLVFTDLDAAKVENIEDYFDLKQSGEILEIAEMSHKYVREHGFTYGSHHDITNIYNQTNGQIDCSAYVTWVVYQMGYTELNTQKTSVWWKNNALKEFPEWERIEIANVEPGDILVVNNIAEGGKDHHVEIYAGDGRSYSCGGNNSINAKETIRTNMGRYEFAIRIPPK